MPPIAGLETVPFLTNRTIFSLERLPARLVVLGGGPTGLELAQAFRRLGSKVAVVELAERLLAAGEPETSAVVASVLADEGIDGRVGTSTERVDSTGSEIAIHVAGGETLRCDALLVATGRQAVLPPGAKALGLQLDRGSVVIDGRCRTTVPGVYAAGDVTGGLLATHVAAHEGSVAGRNAAGARARTDRRVIPAVTFLDPEAARVGITEADARRTRRGVVAVTFPMEKVDRARIAGSSAGFVKIATAARPLLGRLVQMIHAYPAASVAVQQAAAQLYPLGRLLADRSA